MKDEKLLKISLITACIGIFLLFVVLINTDEKVYSISEVKELEDNTDIVIYGTIMWSTETDKVLKLSIAEERIIEQDVLMFKDGKEEGEELMQGEIVKIKGQWYNGRIIADQVERIT